MEVHVGFLNRAFFFVALLGSIFSTSIGTLAWAECTYAKRDKLADVAKVVVINHADKPFYVRYFFKGELDSQINVNPGEEVSRRFKINGK